MCANKPRATGPAFLLVLSGFMIGSGDKIARGAELLTMGQDQLRIVLGEGAEPSERRAAELFASEVKRRTGLDIPIGDSVATKYTLVIGIAQSHAVIHADQSLRAAAGKLKEDGFHLMSAPDDNERIYVVGQSPSGVVAGVGKLLRLSHYAAGVVEVPAVTLSYFPQSENPAMPMRGIYFATHYHNFYHAARLEEVDRVIEDLALWGMNHLLVWFDMHHFENLQDPAAQKHLSRLKHFGKTAQRVGMKFGLGILANEAYANSPEHLRAKWLPGWTHFHVELCPSTPEGLALIGKWQAELLDAFEHLDVVWSWPYDQGGCACDRCMPWGCNGFLRASEQLARLFHERFPKGRFLLSTWNFDEQDEKGKLGGRLISDREYKGLFRYIHEKKSDWIQGIVTGTHAAWIPDPLLKRPMPQKYPLIGFPEISCYRMTPWGGFGANPLPSYCARLAANLRQHVRGAYPYSEGIYEDLNKFFWAQWYWRPDQPTDEILTEYAAYYLGPELARDGVQLFHLLEKTHSSRRRWEVKNLSELNEVGEAWNLAQVINARLPSWSKDSWRWRILYLRAAIDHVLQNQGHETAEAQKALAPFCDELVRIYHAENTWLRPWPFDKK